MKKVLSLLLAMILALGMGVLAFAEVGPDGGNQYILGTSGTVGKNGPALSGTETLHPGDVLYIPVLRADGTPVTKTSALNNDKITPSIKVSKGSAYMEKPEFVVESGKVFVKIKMVEDYFNTKSADLSFTLALAYNRKADKTDSDIFTYDGKFENVESGEIIDSEDAIYYVDGAMIFEVEKNFNGKVSFDFGSDVFFNNVRVFSEQKFLLNLSRQANYTISDAFSDAELDFFNFKGAKDKFSGNGTLVLPADKASYVYEIMEDGSIQAINATYDNSDSAMEFTARALGNYVVSNKKLNLDAFNEGKTEDTIEAPAESSAAPVGSNNNPNTGVSGTVSLVIMAGVVSMAVAGAVAMKK